MAYAELLGRWPEHTQARYSLALVLVSIGQLELAAAHYMTVLRYDESFVPDLGPASHLPPHVVPDADVLALHARLASIEPQGAPIFRNLGLFLMHLGRDAEVLAVLDRALGIDPANPILQEIRARVVRGTPTAALLGTDLQSSDKAVNPLRLTARAAGELPSLATRHLSIGRPWRVADLGCGDGAAAIALRPMCGWLVGVDRDTRAVAAASGRAMFDHVFHADVVAWLNQQSDTYDVLMAADLLPTMGRTDHLLDAAATRLRRKGLLLINVALLPIEDAREWGMHGSGAFLHNLHSLIDRAMARGLILLEERTATGPAAAALGAEHKLLAFRRDGSRSDRGSASSA